MNLNFISSISKSIANLFFLAKAFIDFNDFLLFLGGNFFPSLWYFMLFNLLSFVNLELLMLDAVQLIFYLFVNNTTRSVCMCMSACNFAPLTIYFLLPSLLKMRTKVRLTVKEDSLVLVKCQFVTVSILFRLCSA